MYTKNTYYFSLFIKYSSVLLRISQLRVVRVARYVSSHSALSLNYLRGSLHACLSPSFTTLHFIEVPCFIFRCSELMLVISVYFILSISLTRLQNNGNTESLLSLFFVIDGMDAPRELSIMVKIERVRDLAVIEF